MGRDRDDDDRDDDDRDDGDDRRRSDDERGRRRRSRAGVPHGDGRPTEGEEIGRLYSPWMWALTSSLVILLGLGLLLVFPAASREARRYGGAERCSDGPDGPAATDPAGCLEVIDAVVEGTRRTGGRNADYYVDLRVAEGGRFPPRRQPVSVEVEDTGEVYDSLRAGDRVEVGYWGPDVARITKPGVGSVETIASPAFDAGVTLGLGAVLPLVGGVALRFAFRLRRRTGSWTKRGAVVRGRPSFPKAMAGGALVGAVLGSLVVADSNTYDLGEAAAMWLVTGGFGAFAGGVLMLVVRLVRWARDRG